MIENNVLSTIVVVIICYYVVYPVYFCKLSQIPGPLLYKISRYFSYYDQWREQRNVKVDQFHLKYGPVVQIAPNEIVLNDSKYIKEIYVKNMDKSTYYAPFSSFGEDCLFSTISSKEHLKSKRSIAKSFLKTSILSHGSCAFLQEKISNVVDYIRLVNNEKVKEGCNFPTTKGETPVNVLSLFRAMAMDVVTGYEYGTKFSSNLIFDLEERKVLSSFREGTSLWFFIAVLPGLWKYVVSAEQEKRVSKCREWMDSIFDSSYNAISTGNSTNKDGQQLDNLLTVMYSQGEKREKIASEIIDHILAGHETTANVLTYLVWELSRPVNAHLQDELRVELETAGEDILSIDKLPLLNALLQECLRLHAPIAASQPRITTSDTQLSVTLNNGKSIGVPAGTIVSVQTWSVQRKPEAFHDPDEFHPKRWLKGTESDQEYAERLRLMNSHMLAWGQGNRMCIGQNIAILEVKLAIARVYSTFTTSISSDWCPHVSTGREVKVGRTGMNVFATGKEYLQLNDVDKMSALDTYTSEPLFGECWISFTERPAAR